MKYRVRFQVAFLIGPFFYTEWFDTFDEVKNFVNLADEYNPHLHLIQIEDDNGEIV